MPVEILPHWTFPANWREPVTERLDWRTAVLASASGAEQSFALRMSPRRTFEAMTTVAGPDRTRFDLAVGRVGVDPWYVPVWPDVVRLAAPLPIGSTAVPVDTTFREFKVGGFVMLTDDPARSEVAEIAAVASGSITLADPTTISWPAGTAVYPAIKARLAEQPQMERRANRAFEGFVNFIATDANDHAPAVLSPTYLGLPVLTTEPNEAVNISHAYERIFDENDGEVGLVERSHTSDIGFTVQGYNWTALGRQEHAELRSILYYMDGRNNPIWLPTFAEDFDVLSVGAGLTVRNCGFTLFGGPRENRRDIQIALYDGTSRFGRIVSSTLNLDGTENLVVDPPLTGISAADILRVSFMSRCRLNADSIEFVHITDSDGVSQVAAQFRSAPDTRVAEDYPLAPLGDTVPNDLLCGAAPGCTPFIFLDFAPFVVSAAVTGEQRTNITVIGDPGFVPYTAYVTTEDNVLRFGANFTADYIVDAAIATPAPPTLAFTQSGFASGVLTEYRRTPPFTEFGGVFASGLTIRRFYDTPGTGGPRGTLYDFQAASSYDIVDVWSGALDSYYITSYDGSTIRFGEWSVGDGPLVGVTALTGTFDEVWARPIGSFATGIVVAKSAATQRLSFAVMDFFTGVVSGSGFVSDGVAARERHLVTRVAAAVGKTLFVWREYSGATGPAGSVKARYRFGGVMEATVTLYTLAPLTVAGYTNLANREPVAAAVLPNGNIAIVERRYEQVGAQMRAYEVLVVHAPFEPVTQSNVLRLTPEGVGPTGDVRRSADVMYSAGDLVWVSFENPVDDTGTTEVVSQRVSMFLCSSTSAPE